MKLHHRFFLFIGLSCLCFSLFSQNNSPVFKLSQLENVDNLNDFLQILPPEFGDQKAFSEIQNSTDFLPYDPDETLLSHLEHWGKITFQNDLIEFNEIRDWRLFIGNANYIEVYFPDSSGIYPKDKIEYAGNLESEKNKSLKFANRKKRVPFNLHGRTPQTIFIKITGQNHEPTEFDIRLSREDFFQSWEFHKKTRADWLFLGFLATMLVFNLLLFFGTRDLAFFYHFLFLFGVNIYLFEFFGIMEDAIFFRENPFYIQQNTYVMLTLLDVGYIMFVRTYMNLKKLMPKGDRVLRGMVIARIVLGVSTIVLFQVTKYEPLTDQLTAIYMISEYLFLLAFVAIIYRTGDSKAWFLLVGTLLIVIGVILSAVSILTGGIIQAPFVQLGLTGEIFFFSLGLAHRMKLLQKEEQEAQRLKDLNDFKARFYTNITHEFRTPLTVINGMSSELAEGSSELSVSEKVKKDLRGKLDLIKRNGDNLLSLVNRILDLAKLESGRMELNLKKGDIISYLNYLTESFHSFAKSKNIQIKFLTELDQLDMDFDSEKIQQVVSNLMSNAVKFTPENGKITLLAKLFEDKNKFFISVKDTGIGIGNQELTKIFDRFYQAGNSAKKPGEGTGVGLSLTKELVQLMNGKIEAESEPGEGTEFRVWLPYRSAAFQSRDVQITKPAENLNQNIPVFSKPSANPESENALTLESESVAGRDAATESRATLLIVEDSPDIVQYLKTILEKNYNIITAFDGKQGIETAFETIPDIIISDVMMPEKDGFEVCETLKNDEKTSHIPIILLTAKATVQDRIAGLSRGADAYLAKPFDKEELMIRLKKLTELRQKLRARYSTFESPVRATLVVAPGTESPENEAFKTEDEFIIRLKKLIFDHLDDSEYSIAHICRGMMMSRAQLHRKITALTGKSTSIYVRSIRLHHARHLLKTTDLNISEIAYDVGFKDPNYFSRTYNEEFGETPTETRN